MNKRKLINEHDSLIKDAVLKAKAIKDVATAEAKEQILESLDSRIKRIVAKKINEGDDIYDDDNIDEILEGKEGPDTEQELSDEEIEEVMQELKTELDETIEEAEEEALEETEDETIEETEDESLEEAEDDLNEISMYFESEGDEESLEETEDETIEETEDETLEEAARRIISLRKKLKEAYNVIKQQRDAIDESMLLNTKLKYYTKLNSKLNLNENQKINIINVLDNASNKKELNIAYLGILEGIRNTRSQNNTQNRTKKENISRPTTKLKSNIKESLQRNNLIKSKNSSNRNIISENKTTANRSRFNTSNKSNTGTLRERLIEKLNRKENNTLNTRIGLPTNKSTNERSAINSNSNKSVDRKSLIERLSNRLLNKSTDLSSRRSNLLSENRLTSNKSQSTEVKRIPRFENKFQNDIITQKRKAINEGVDYKGQPVITDDMGELRDRFMKLGKLK